MLADSTYIPIAIENEEERGVKLSFSREGQSTSRAFPPGRTREFFIESFYGRAQRSMFRWSIEVCSFSTGDDH